MSLKTTRTREYRTQNSWRRRSITILGKAIEQSGKLHKQIFLGQRIIALSSCFVLLFFVVNTALFNYGNVLLSVCMVLSFLGICGGFGLLYYDNVSLVILRKLSREPYVWIVFILALSNMIIDCAMPFNAFSPIAGTMYFIAVCLVLTFDVVNTKSRALTVGTATVFMLVTLWNILRHFFGNVDAGVVLLKYGESYTIYKNSVKRSIFIEI